MKPNRHGPDPLPGVTDGFLPFAKPSITDREEAAVLEVLRSGWLTMGPKTKQFENAFAAYVGSRHAVAVNSATSALHLALDALHLKRDEEVIVPTWTFAASAEVVAYFGARPVLVDIEPETLNAPVGAILRALTPRTRAVIAVHFAGRQANIRELVSELDKRDIPVVEDAAHAFPCRIGGVGGRFAGTIGRIGAYSFYATKTITTAEGGMLVTDIDEVADRARLMALHGISRGAWNRYSAAGSWYYEIEDVGFKYNMTDLAAAMGLVQLSRADELLAARRTLAQAYTQRLRDSEAADLVTPPIDDLDGSHAWHLYVVRLAVERLSIDRAEIIERLKALGVGTSVHFIPLHLHPYYRRTWGYSPEACPIATEQFRRVISLPLWPGMTLSDVDRVVTCLTGVLQSARI